MDSISITGDRTSHTISWNTGALTILAFGGRRTSEITRRYLHATNKYQQFYQLCEHRYIAVFGNDTLEGDGLPFALPSRSLPKVANYEQCDANVQSFSSFSQFCIDGSYCFGTLAAFQITCNCMSLPLIILILYIAIVKHRGEKATHKWFTLHLFTVHLISVSTWLIANLILYASYLCNLKLSNVYNYIERFYIPHCFTLIMSVTLLSMASGYFFPMFYKKWLTSAKRWHTLMLICHLVAMFATFPGDYSNTTSYQVETGSYVVYISLLFYFGLFISATMALVVVIKMKQKISDVHSAIAASMEIKTMIATLSYAVVPTIWCCGSQVMDFGLAFTAENDLASQFSIASDLKTVATICSSTYPLAYSIATLVGLGPYRRSLVKMVTDFKRKIKADHLNS